MTSTLFSLATAGVQGLKPYEPGKPIEELERELGISNAIKLASNENPLGMSPLAREAIQRAMDTAALYPDGNAFYLKKALADYHGLDLKQITIGNGSNDLLEIIARSFADKESEIIYSQYGFAVYPIVTQAIGATHKVAPAVNWGHDLNAMLRLVSHNTKIIFIANPNNPTGTYIGEQPLQEFIRQVPKSVIVVLDEAYHEYISQADYSSGLHWTMDYPNVIVTRTFSKAYGLAGLRIGYSVSHPDIANVLNRVRQPFNANSFALAAAQAALRDQRFIQQAVETNHQGMQQVCEGLEQLNLNYIPSVGNFIAVDVKRDGNQVNQGLLQRGVIIRPIAAYQMPTHIRVSIGLSEQNSRFLSALAEVVKGLEP